MGLLDFLSDNNPFGYEPGQADRAQFARLQAAQQLEEFKAKQAAQAKLGLTPDKNGILWNQQQMPTGATQTLQNAPVTQDNPGGLMQDPSGQPQFTPGQMPPQNLLGIQQDYRNQQRSLLDMADPETALKSRQGIAARQANDAYINSLDLPPDIKQSVTVGNLPGGAEASKALATNLTVPDALRTINAHLSTLNKAAPGSPEYQVASAALKQATQNIPAATLAEAIRHNKAEEANSAITSAVDPNTGGTVFFDKRTNSMVNPFPDPFGGQAPPNSQPPGAAQQAPGASPQASKPPVFNDDYIKSLPVEAQAKFASLAPGMQLQLGPILAGKMAPPESGRAMTDPKLQNMMRYAALIDPSFNEQTWRQRNKMATEAVDMTPSKLGGMKASAQKIINHGYDALGAASDVNNNSSLGTLGNYVGNSYVNNTSPGTPGSGQEKKADINANAGYSHGVAAEFEKLMSGGAGSVADRERALELLPQNGDISSTIGGLTAITEMMRGQVEPQVRAYNDAMGTKLSVEDWLGPEASKKYNTIKGLAADLKSGKKVDSAAVKKAMAGERAPINAQNIVDELKRRGVINR